MATVPSEVEQAISGESHIAHLATAVEGQPHVAPVWYHYEDDVIQITTAGKKVRNVRRNSRVAVSIQTDEEGHPEWVVHFQGEATVVDDAEGIKRATWNVYEHYLGDDPEEWDEFWQQQITDPDDERSVVEVEIDSVVTKRF